MTRALILDFGEVLVRPQSDAIVAEMALLAGFDVGEFHRRYWQHRRDYDSGLPADRYWRRVLDGSSVPPQVIERTIAALEDADARSWTDYREVMWGLAASFKTTGGRTALLSNGVPEVMARVRAERPLADYFDVVIVSCEIGRTKPDPAVYELCLERLAVPAAAALFVDDRIENIDAARRLGIDTVLFRGDASIDEVRVWTGIPPL